MHRNQIWAGSDVAIDHYLDAIEGRLRRLSELPLTQHIAALGFCWAQAARIMDQMNGSVQLPTELRERIGAVFRSFCDALTKTEIRGMGAHEWRLFLEAAINYCEQEPAQTPS